MKTIVRPVNIVEILKKLVLSFASIAEMKNINLSFLSSQESIIVYVDIDKFEKVILNLICMPSNILLQKVKSL